MIFYLRFWAVLLGAVMVAGTESPSSADALVSDLRAARPPENMEIRGTLRIRDAEGHRTRIPFRYQVILGDKEWQSVYETESTDARPAEKLVVTFTPGKAPRYAFSRAPESGAPLGKPVELSGDEAMIPFAQSDFWLADLAMSFLHWPRQTLVENLTIKRRQGRVCHTLESENPSAGAKGYTRVQSWIDRETGQPITAEAFDAAGRQLKEFQIGSVKKVDGRWQLKNMEMRNLLTDSQTVLEFIYETKE